MLSKENKNNNYIIKKYIYSLGNLLKNQKRKSSLAMQNNEIMVNLWLNEDKKYLSNSISIIDNLDQFLAADFKLEEKNGILTISNDLNWCNIINNRRNSENRKINNSSIYENNYNNKEESNENNKVNNNAINNKYSSNQNIILKNKVIRLKENSIFLRSLSVEVEIDLLMSGESSFYIFSRCIGEFTETTSVCCVSKELESARKFISFGVLEKKEEGKFYVKGLKKQEIPHQDNHIKSLDISEIKFIFIDNGDNRCFVFLTGQELLNSNLYLVGDFYVPIEIKSNLMFAVCGDLVSIKRIVIKQTYRNSYINYKNSNTNDSIQSCSCCKII